MSLPKIDPFGELQLPYERTQEHPAFSANGTVRIDKIPAGRKVRIMSVSYINPTGLVTDAANYFAGDLKKNVGGVAATIANFANTNSAGGAAVVADTWTAPTLTTTDVDRVLSGGDTLDLAFTKTGTQTLPAGRIVIRGRYV